MPTRQLNFQSPAFNAALGLVLVVANTSLAAGVWLGPEVSEDDKLFRGLLLTTAGVAQLLLLARASWGGYRTFFFVLFGLGLVATLLAWAGFFWLVAFAKGFNH